MGSSYTPHVSDFSYEKSDTCGVAIGFHGPKTIEQTKYQINQKESY